MSYREENGQVVLTITPEDFRKLNLMLDGSGLVLVSHLFGAPEGFLIFMDRLNEGNPNWRPYQVEPTPSAASHSLTVPPPHKQP